MLKHRLPLIGRLYRQRDKARNELREVREQLSHMQNETETSVKPVDQRLYVLEGVMLEIPLNIMSDKFHSDLMNGTYEDKELSPIRKNLRPDDTVLELGAAVGFISTWVAKMLPQGRVVTYEANPNMIPVAANNHKRNNVNVVLNHALVTSSDSETMDFFVDKTFFWDSGIYARAHDNGSVREKISVRSENFSKILREVDPSILIIDIEGGEVGLFDNVSSLGRVRHIFFELHAFIGPLEIHRIFKKLDELGYVYDEIHSTGYIATFSLGSGLITSS
ncbi:FkbM family methyltransferase [Rhodoblastus sphagnicola]|nr:FkbM family methyltransferase [Rhodoblastus sphagnicola]MBB4198054.1 FkbM family methyltransferase [Rhodoblastus sphagnicola]